MEDFTAGTISSQPTRKQQTLGAEWDARVHKLVSDFGAEYSPELIEEMILTALRMARDKMSVADLKLISRSMKEMRYAAKIFAGYQAFRKVGIFGSARIAQDSPEAKVAEEFARQMVAHNFMIITGGGDGIMGAAQRGAGRDMSFGLNIRLPFEQRANETIEGDKKLINFNYFFTRKLNFVKETHAAALFPGGFGTLDESFEVLTLMQTGKARIIPVVLLDKPDGDYWETWMKFLTQTSLQDRFHLGGRFLFFQNYPRCRSGSERDHRLLSYLSVGAVGGGEACYPDRAPTLRCGSRRIKRQIRRCFAPRRDCPEQGVTPGTKRARDSQLASARSYSASPQLRTFSAIDRCD